MYEMKEKVIEDMEYYIPLKLQVILNACNM